MAQLRPAASAKSSSTDTGPLPLPPRHPSRAQRLPHSAERYSGLRVPDALTPLALAYAGHQFGHFVPQLGDGRAILLGSARDRDGARFDVQLKGAGRTAFSRRGGGRSSLGPVVRKFFLSEAMHALGVPMTRSLAAVSTGEVVLREAELSGAILTHVASSHVRVGTFEYFAARRGACATPWPNRVVPRPLSAWHRSVDAHHIAFVNDGLLAPAKRTRLPWLLG